jgi:hypothetical protein
LVADGVWSICKDAILKRIFELYDPCPICGGFFDKSDKHHHDDF